LRSRLRRRGDAAKITRGVRRSPHLERPIIEREIDFAPIVSLICALRCATRLHTAKRSPRINDYMGREQRSRSIPRPSSSPSEAVRRQGCGAADEIEQLQIERIPAKIVIDERSGIIVMGRDVRVSTVAVRKAISR